MQLLDSAAIAALQWRDSGRLTARGAGRMLALFIECFLAHYPALAGGASF